MHFRFQRALAGYFLISTTCFAAVSLKSAYESALSRHESIQLQLNREKQSEERVTQTKAAALPSLLLSGSVTRQDDSDSTSSVFSNPNQWTSRLGLTIPLFRGFGEYAAIQAADLDQEAQTLLLEQRKADLFAEVSKLYFDTLSALSDLHNLEAQKQLTEKRIKDLEAFARIGRSRTTEVLAAQAQLALQISQIENAENAAQVLRDQLTLLTGISSEEKLDETTAENFKVGGLPQWLNQLEQRADVRALLKSRDAAERRISISRAGHWPSLDLNGNYYPTRSGALAGVHWDSSLSLSFPLYQGGLVNSRVREDTLKWKEAELLLAQARRNATGEITTAFHNVENAEAQVRVLATALALTEKNYQAQVKDYSLGLVSNLETLQALNTFQEAKRSLDRARFQLQSAWTQLQTSTGNIPTL